jgi:hypothetical protein
MARTINIARDGASHDKLQPVQIHGASYHIRNGQMIAGVSKTQAATTSVTTPTVAKLCGAAPTKPGMRSRTARNDALKPRKV